MKKRIFLVIILLLVFISGCSSKPSALIINDITANKDGFNITEYKFEVQYSKETKEVNFMESMFSDEDLQKFETIGNHKVTIKYEGLSKEFNVTLLEKPTEIEATEIRTCIDTFDVSKFAFKAFYENSEETVNYSLDMFSKEDQAKFQLEGEHIVTFNYRGISKQLTVILEEFKIASIRPISESYVFNVREFEYYMIEFEVLYNDNTSEKVTLERDYLSNQDIVALSKAGTHTVTVTYEDVETTITVELIPDEKPIEELKQKVIVYCVTKKVNDKYVSSYYIKGNEAFNAAQFRIVANDDVEGISITNAHNNVIASGEKEITVAFVNSENIEEIKLFDVEYTSPQQYRNFNLDFGFNRKITYIKNNEVIEFNTSDVIYTFTR